MEFDDFKSQMDAWWYRIDAEALGTKNTMMAPSALIRLYENWGPVGRGFADRVVAEWIQSDEVSQRYDARLLIDRFEIRSALGGVQSQIDRLRDQTSTSSAAHTSYATFELTRLQEIADKLRSPVSDPTLPL